MMVKCEEMSAITLVVRVLIKNKIAKLIATKIKMVKKFPNDINRAKVR